MSYFASYWGGSVKEQKPPVVRSEPPILMQDSLQYPDANEYTEDEPKVIQGEQMPWLKFPALNRSMEADSRTRFARRVLFVTAFYLSSAASLVIAVRIVPVAVDVF